MPTRATITRVENDPILITCVGANVDAGTDTVTLSYSMINFEKGFTIQTGTLTDCTVTVWDSADGAAFVDSTPDYFGTGVATAASNKSYKIDLDAPVYMVQIRVVTTDATNAFSVTVFAPNR